MKVAILVGREAAAFHQRNRERVAQCQHHRGRGRGRQPHGAGFLRLRQDQRNIGGLDERRVPAAGADADDRHTDPPGIGDQVGEFRRLAAIRKKHQRIVARDHTKIAMARFGGMDEVRRRSGRRKGRCDLARDMSALAHAADDHAVAHAHQHVDGAAEVAVQRV